MKPIQNNKPLSIVMINACYEYPGQIIAISLATHKVIAASSALSTLEKSLKKLPANSYILLRSCRKTNLKSKKA